jgi:hypothetical protein
MLIYQVDRNGYQTGTLASRCIDAIRRNRRRVMRRSRRADGSQAADSMA